MTWLPALAAGGAVLALGPIIIHILFRRRYRVVDFAAMRFLLDSLKRNRQKLRLEEIFIIALRVLACLLIGLMLADIRAAGVLPGGRAPAAHVFVLDDSLSMGQRAGGAALFQKAVTQLADTIGKLNDNDRVAILSASRPDAGNLLGDLVLARDVKRDDFTRRLTALKPTDLRARFPDALVSASKLLASQKDMAGRVYVVSDFRRSDWAEPQAAEMLRRAFAAAAAGSEGRKTTEFTLLDYGLPCPNNLSIEKIELLDKLAVAGVGSQFQVSVRNTGTAGVDGAMLTVRMGDATLPAIPLPAVAPGETVKKTFRYVFPQPGSAAVRVSLTPDALPADDVAALAVPVFDALRVLIVDGSDNPGSLTSSSFCLAHALDPSGGKGTFGQRVDVISPQALNEGDLDSYDAIILTNVRDFSASPGDAGKTIYPQLAALERYVRAGGGLGIFVGDRVSPDFYNGPMYGNGTGLIPLRIADATLPVPDREHFVRLRPDSIANGEPMLRVYTGATEKFSRLVRFYGYLHAQETNAPMTAEGVGPAQVLARFDDKDGSPAVARRAFGRGTVVMWYTAADPKWTDWPKDMTFLPVVNDMAWSLARRRDGAFDAPVGRTITYTLPANLSDATGVALKTPAYPAEDVQMLQPKADAQGGGRQKAVAFAGATHAGLYEMEVTLPDRSQRTVYFSRTIDPAEAELTKADEKEIAAAVGRPHTYRGNLAVSSTSLVESSARHSYWPWLLAALLCVLGLETFLAQRFGHYGEGGERPNTGGLRWRRRAAALARAEAVLPSPLYAGERAG